MTDYPQWTPQPPHQQPFTPIPPVPPKKPKVLLPLIVFGVVAAVAVAITLVLTWPKSHAATPAAVVAPKTFVVHGTMSVTCSSYGCGGYSDLTTGAQVEVLNQDNKVLGVGTLLPSSTYKGNYSSSDKDFEFDVKDIPRGERLYGVHVGNNNRGVIWKTEEEASTVGFAVSIGS